MTGPDLTLQMMMTRILPGVVIITLQGAAIAASAAFWGDKGTRYDGRVSLLPSRHIDTLGLVTFVLTGFGWGRPVAIDPGEMRNGRWGLILTVVASSLVLLLLGWLSLLLVIPVLTSLPHTSALLISAFLHSMAQLCIWMMLFSLIPLPPLPGAHILGALGIRLPPIAGSIFGWLLFGASFLGVTRFLLAPAFQVVAIFVMGADFIR